MKNNNILWEKDEEISYCNKCRQEFTLFIRKHHCRNCGKIFCYKCINHIQNTNKTRYILCNKCSEQHTMDRKYNIILSVLKISKILDIRDLKNLGILNKKWYNVTKIILNDFYSIQSNLGELSNYEKDLLYINKKHLCGHFNYIYKCLFFNKKDLLFLLNNKSMINCSIIQCKNCSSTNINNYICLLNNINCYTDYTEKILNDKDMRYELIFYICLQMKNFILSIDDIIFKLINEKCRYDNYFLYFFWSFENLSHIYKDYYEFYQTVRNSLFIKLNNIQKSNIKDMYNFIDLMKSVDLSNSQEINYNLINSYLLSNKPTYLFDLNEKIIKLINIHKVNSNSKPIIYTFQTETKTVSFLIKKEDMQIDNIIINTINFTKKLLKNIIPEENIITYRVIPSKNKFGIIEIVKDSITLADINNQNISLSNYIFNNNHDLSIDKIRMNFVYSLSFYSVICYILGLGDRHLDNIMITKSGLLFHIDFSYILGNDPKKNIAPEIRITEQMIDVLGGPNSKYYETFQLICRKSFMKIKHYFYSYYELLKPISLIDPQYSDIKIQNFLKGRFMTHLTYNVADIKFNNQVLLDKSSQSQLIDYFHSYGVYKDGIKNIITDKFNSIW